MKYLVIISTLVTSHICLAGPTMDQEKQLEDLINRLENVTQPEKKNCVDYPEQKPVAPVSDEYPKIAKREFSRCQTRDEGYQYCSTIDTKKPQAIEIKNIGGSVLIPEKNADRARTWRFNFPYQARQDMYFAVTDEPNHNNSQLRESYMYLFPRKNTPAIRSEGGKLIVTLPTGEQIYFDAKTKDLLNEGVLKETGGLAKVSKELDPPKVKYVGTGVLVRVNSRGKDPRLSGGVAQITKQGKTCEVAKSELWPDQSSNSAVHFRFSRDEDFDAYLLKKCGFGIN